LARNGASQRELARRQTCTFEVRFAPVAPGTFSNSLDLPTNAATPTLTVTGRALPQEPIPLLGGAGLALGALAMAVAGVWLALRRGA